MSRDFRFLARVEHYPYEYEVYGADIPLPPSPVCTHCGKTDRRQDTYVFCDGQTILHDCLGEYLGSDVAALSLLLECDLAAHLAHPRRAAEGTERPVESIVSDPAVHEFVNKHLATKPDAHLTATEAALVVAFRSGYVPPHRVGLVRAAVRLYEAHQQKAGMGDQFTGRHLGTVGERLTFTATVDKVHGPFPGEYGDSYLCTFKTADGDTLIWWTGENLYFEEGTGYTVRGTVAEHGEHNGVRQTRVTRVREVFGG